MWAYHEHNLTSEGNFGAVEQEKFLDQALGWRHLTGREEDCGGRLWWKTVVDIVRSKKWIGIMQSDACFASDGGAVDRTGSYCTAPFVVLDDRTVLYWSSAISRIW